MRQDASASRFDLQPMSAVHQVPRKVLASFCEELSRVKVLRRFYLLRNRNALSCRLQQGCAGIIQVRRGELAEWLRSGLQIRVHRFDSGTRLHLFSMG